MVGGYGGAYMLCILMVRCCDSYMRFHIKHMRCIFVHVVDVCELWDVVGL